MAIEVFPTANDIGGSGTGRTATEENMVQSVTPGNPKNTILSGMVPAEGAGLAMAVATGTALIEGYLVRFKDVESFTVTDDATKYVWLQLTGTGSYQVTAAAFIETADLTEPTASALVAKVVSSGGDIDSVEDDERREGFGYITGTYTGDGASSQDIDLGQTPCFLHINKIDSTTARSSNIWPGNAVLTGYDSGNFNPLIIKDGFRAIGNGAGQNNDGGYVYNYIAWF
jgi:hypothetical protein